MARSDRERWAQITAVGIALVAGSALVAVPAIAADGSTGSGSGAGSGSGTGPKAHVVVCESGVIDHGNGIQTSSASAERVAADAPVPDACTAR